MPAPAIIDYASPVPRSRMRLPARSEIRWAREPGRLVITQVLGVREGAIAAPSSRGPRAPSRAGHAPGVCV
jgi:hypothetical protein